MVRDEQPWLKVVANLKVDRSRGVAPHKPLLLLATNCFDEAGDAASLLKRMAGRQVQLPGKRDYWPDKTHLAWHRQQKFATQDRQPMIRDR